MNVGFIHGVMNTDNMTISGETIDYGPCAFIEAYDPATVFSSIDHQGRYAYANQPAIARWNLARLAEALLLLCLAFAARALVARWLPLAVFQIAVPVLVSLLVIRVGVKVLQAAFTETPLVRLLEHTISWLAWGAVVLWVSGLLPIMLEELDQIHWKVGGTSMSVRTLIEGTLTAGAVLLFTLWISAAIEARLLQSATGGELSLRKALSNATRVVLMFVGLLLALSAVGVDLTALSVLGGAIGVGVGFGLQKLAGRSVASARRAGGPGRG